MRTDSRLPRVLHLLLHLGHLDDPVTSDLLGKMLGMNASLVRRTMAGLREAGFVNATKGHGGGWVLAKPLEEITLVQIYQALGKPKLFAIGLSNDTPTCLLERSANDATTNALAAARGAFEAELNKTTVADLAAVHGETIAAYQKARQT